MTNIVGITAPGWGSGKDTVANILAIEYGYRVLGFSEILKEDLYNRVTHEVFPNLNVWLAFVEDAKYKGAQEKGAFIRKLLQGWGQLFRYKDEDYWVNSWEDSITASGLINNTNIAVPSVRFPNEAQRIKELGGYLVRVIRPGIQVDNDPSETSMTNYPVDYSIINDGSLLDLRERVHQMMKDLGLVERNDGIVAAGHTKESKGLK